MNTGAAVDGQPADTRKQALRAAARSKRAELASGAEKAAERLRDLALAALPWPAEACVSAYWPMGDELDPRPLCAALARRGHALALPVMQGAGKALKFRRWRPGDPLRPAAFGTHEPLPRQPEVEPDVLLVPLLAFDRRGYRLGYGGGFYDRTLAALRARRSVLAVGLAYSGQEVAAVPCDGHDQALDFVATEREIVTAA